MYLHWGVVGADLGSAQTFDYVPGRIIICECTSSMPRVLMERSGEMDVVSAAYVGGGMAPHQVRVFIDYLVKELKDAPLLAPVSAGGG